MNPAQQARETAIAQSEGGADVLFIHAALEAIEQVAKTKPEFIADDVKAICNVTPRELRSWGGVLRRAEKLGWISATDRVQASTDRTCHARRKAVWKSWLYQPAQNKPAPLFEMEPEYPRN